MSVLNAECIQTLNQAQEAHSFVISFIFLSKWHFWSVKFNYIFRKFNVPENDSIDVFIFARKSCVEKIMPL